VTRVKKNHDDNDDNDSLNIAIWNLTYDDYIIGGKGVRIIFHAGRKKRVSRRNDNESNNKIMTPMKAYTLTIGPTKC
jgi:hypothetical protein